MSMLLSSSIGVDFVGMVDGFGFEISWVCSSEFFTSSCFSFLLLSSM